MPLEFIELDVNRQALGTEDRGFLVSVAKSRWTKTSASESLRLLKSFAQAYYLEKCPESKPEVPEETKDVPIEDSEGKTETATVQKKNTETVIPRIQFCNRKVSYSNCGFIASNLADPSDYCYYIMTQFAEGKRDTKTKFAFRIMPVQAVCEARPRAVEKTALPLIQSILGADEQPHRFSILYRGRTENEYLSQHDAKAIIRNCVWSVNPNCVQCIKYQDYAIIIDILAPQFCIGIAKDFQRLAGYNTRAVRLGLDLTDLGEDSEDDISDDPNLDEEDEKRRKLKIKRKRRAEKAELEQPEGGEKRRPKSDDEDEEDESHGQEHDLQDDEEDEGREKEADEENEAGENGM
uniref:THUMP domain-containing protein n=1 Tax=Arion vulgaris TaxID=1028688 RepID=A0A0B6ZN89_9EUPU